MILATLFMFKGLINLIKVTHITTQEAVLLFQKKLCEAQVVNMQII